MVNCLLFMIQQNTRLKSIPSYFMQLNLRLNPAILVFSACLLCSSSSFATSLTLELINQELATQEARFSDIVEGAEKSVRWYKGVKQTELALVYLHGFSASPKELSPVTEQLADKLGANIYYARLTGHGRSSEAMAEASVQDWLNDTEQAWQIGQLIGKRVVFISVSTGGTLAAWLGVQGFAQEMAINILISPNFGVASRSAGIVRWNWGFRLAKWLTGPTREFTPQSELHAKYWTYRYPLKAVVPMIKLVDQVQDQDYDQTTIDTVMIYSPDDAVIRPDRIQQIAKQMRKAKVELIEFTESTDPYQHVLAGDAVSPESNQAMIELLYGIIKGKRGW